MDTVRNRSRPRLTAFKVDGKKLSSTVQDHDFKRHLREILDDCGPPQKAHRVYTTCPPLRGGRLQGWLDGRIGEAARAATRYAQSMEGLHRQQTSVETQLRKIPAEDQIRPVIDELKAKYQQLAHCQQQLGTIQQEIDQRRNKFGRREERDMTKQLTICLAVLPVKAGYILSRRSGCIGGVQVLLILRKVRGTRGRSNDFLQPSSVGKRTA